MKARFLRTAFVCICMAILLGLEAQVVQDSFFCRLGAAIFALLSAGFGLLALRD